MIQFPNSLDAHELETGFNLLSPLDSNINLPDLIDRLLQITGIQVCLGSSCLLVPGDHVGFDGSALGYFGEAASLVVASAKSRLVGQPRGLCGSVVNFFKLSQNARDEINAKRRVQLIQDDIIEVKILVKRFGFLASPLLTPSSSIFYSLCSVRIVPRFC